MVAAAVLHRRRVLAARRTAPPALAGRWELPGGKVEPGEDPSRAVVRELAEELGCTVRVTGWLPGRSEVRPGLALVVATAALVEGEPVAAEHDRLRWLGADELTDVDWLEPDRPFLAPLAAVLEDAPVAAPDTRAVLHEREDAEAVTEALRAAGHRAEVVRERLSGEDDDEDHDWAVLAAPGPAGAGPLEELLGTLLERHDGWLDRGALAAPVPPPLPRAPRRRGGG